MGASVLAITEHPCSGASRAGAEVRVEEKLDGALIIRSVIGGEVVFCTRGTFDGGERGREARRIKAEINELPEGERDAALLIFDGREGPAAERLRDAFIAAALARRSPAES